MRVSLRHTTLLAYTAPVTETVMEVRLGPLGDAHQQWSRFDLRTAPAAAQQRFADGFGNMVHLVTLARAHLALELTAGGEVETLLSDPFAPPRWPPPPLSPAERADFLLQASPLVPPHAGLADLAARADADEPFGRVQRLMELVYRGFEYRGEVTDVSTTVDEVLASRAGVCQDFAHVLIGLCRATGVPARYVSGYIVQSDGQRPERGAGASHAWVEAWTPSHGWRGFDPTNNLLASEHHVKMAVGRDYQDVAPTRGTYRGSAGQELSVEVVARPQTSSSPPPNRGQA